MEIKKHLLVAIMFALTASQLKAQETATANIVAIAKTIDGDLSDWDENTGFQEGTKFSTVDAARPWIPQNNKLFWKSAWDDTNFYLAIKVEDASVVPYIAGIKEEMITFSIGTDITNTGGWGTVESNWGGIVFIPVDGEVTVTGGKFAFECVTKRSADAMGNGVGGYIMEASIPWATFGETPVMANEYLFNVVVRDYDPYDGMDDPALFNDLGWATADNTWLTMENVGLLTLGDVANGISDTKMAELELDIFPNPVANILNVHISNEIQYIYIYTLTGQRLKEFFFKGMNNVAVNVSDIEKGFYLIQIETTDGVFSKRFLKK